MIYFFNKHKVFNYGFLLHVDLSVSIERKFTFSWMYVKLKDNGSESWYAFYQPQEIRFTS